MFYFTPLPGFFSPFPHGTGSLSVIQEYLVLRGGPRKFKRGSTCPSLLGIQFEAIKVFDYETFTLCGAVFQLLPLTFKLYLMLSLNPLKIEFRLVPFRSPLLRESLLLSFPLVTKMFQFTRFALSSLWIQEVVHEVSLFGNFRIKTCFQFPETFRW